MRKWLALGALLFVMMAAIAADTVNDVGGKQFEIYKITSGSDFYLTYSDLPKDGSNRPYFAQVTKIGIKNGPTAVDDELGLHYATGWRNMTVYPGQSSDVWELSLKTVSDIHAAPVTAKRDTILHYKANSGTTYLFVYGS